MAACPFCKAEISEFVASQGGTCGSCLTAIPGEDAATDPGVVAPPPPPASSAPRLALLFAVGLFVGLIALVGLGGVAVMGRDGGQQTGVQSRPQIPLSRHEDQPMAASDPEPEQQPAVAPPSAPEVPETPEADELDGIADASGGAPPVAAEAPGLATRPTSLDDMRGLTGAPRSRAPEGLVLTDPDEIDSMIAGVMKAKDATLRQCYERRLKEREDLIGGWRVSFTLSGSGKAEGASVRPLGMRDEEFEACMVQNIEDWGFQRIDEPVDVVKTWRFGPGF